jgi:hypothetical protein
MNLFTTSFQTAVSLKKIGFPQESIFYHHNKTKDVVHSKDMPVYKDWNKHYTAAHIGADFDKYLPAGTAIRLTKFGTWYAESGKLVSRSSVNLIDAKADLVQKLFANKLIQF